MHSTPQRVIQTATVSTQKTGQYRLSGLTPQLWHFACLFQTEQGCLFKGRFHTPDHIKSTRLFRLGPSPPRCVIHASIELVVNHDGDRGGPRCMRDARCVPLDINVAFSLADALIFAQSALSREGQARSRYEIGTSTRIVAFSYALGK